VDNISSDLTKGANAVIRYHKINVLLEHEDRMIISESAAITVFNKRSDYILKFYEGYNESSDRITDIVLEYLDASGNVIEKVKPKRIEEVTPGDGMSLISDQKAKYFGYEATNFPITIKYSFVKVSSNTIYMPSWYPILASRLSVENSSFRIENNTPVEIETQENNLEDYNVIRNGPLSFELKNAKHISIERYGPALDNLMPIIVVRPDVFHFEGKKGSFKDWNEYGKWVYQDLLVPRMTLDENEIRTSLASVIETEDNKYKIAKSIYEFVQSNTRYVLISLEDGGLAPLTTKEVHEKKYGDCKALTFYTQSLLSAYGIGSSYVVNHAGLQKKSLDSDFCSRQSNHIILMVPLESDTLWMDCTNNDAPFNFLGAFTDDRVVLAVNESGGKLVRTPKYGADLYKDIAKTVITIADNGSISVDYNIVNHGIAMDRRQFFYNQSEEEKIDDLKEDFDHLLNLKISNLEIDVDKDNLMSTEHFVIESGQYGEQAGQYYIIPMRFEPLSVPNLGKKKTRKHPILFERAYKEIKEDTYIVPQGFIPNLNIKDVNYEGEYGKYSRTIEKLSDTKFVIKRSFELAEGEYPAADYLKVKSFFNKIRKEELAKMNIEKKIIRP